MTDEEASQQASPFPPYYSPGPLTWATPFFTTPTALLVLAAVFGLGRYLQTRATPWQEPNHSSRRRLDPLSKLIVALALTIVVTFLGDAGVVVARALFESSWTSSVFAYYIGVSWLAWVLSLVSLTDETYKYGEWTWVQYTFWMAAFLGETMVAWLWAVGMLRPRPGKRAAIRDA